MFHQLLDAGLHGFLEGQFVAIERVIGGETGRNIKERIIKDVLQEVCRIGEVEHITDGIADAIRQGGAGMDDIAVARQGVAVHTGSEHAQRLRFLAGRSLLRRLGIPAGGGSDGVALAHRHVHDFMHRIRELPVQARPEQLALADTDHPAEAQFDGYLV